MFLPRKNKGTSFVHRFFTIPSEKAWLYPKIRGGGPHHPLFTLNAIAVAWLGPDWAGERFLDWFDQKLQYKKRSKLLRVCLVTMFIQWYRCDCELGKPPDKKSAVFLTLFKRGRGDHSYVQKLCCEFCIIEKALCQHKLRHRKECLV